MEVLGYALTFFVCVISAAQILRERAAARRHGDACFKDGYREGKEEMALFVRAVAREKAASSKNGVCVKAELVGGPGDGVLCLVAKDAPFVWMGIRGECFLYLFAHRSHQGRWVFEYEKIGKKGKV